MFWLIVLTRREGSPGVPDVLGSVGPGSVRVSGIAPAGVVVEDVVPAS